MPSVKAEHFTAAFLVGAVSFGIGGLWSFLDAYYLSPPNWKFGRDGAFQLGIYASARAAVCVAASFVATLPLYLRLFPGRGMGHFKTYSAVFVGGISLAWWSGGATYIDEFVAAHVIPSFSGNGLPEIALSFLVTSLALGTLLCCVVFAVERIFMHPISPQS